MQKIVVTYLASLILFQGLFINKSVLLEFNELVADYQIHKVNYGDDFTDFLSKHFGDLKESHQHQHQQEHKEHKEHQHPQSDFNFSFQTDFVAQQNTNYLNDCTVKEKRKSLFFYKNLFSTFEKPTILQPPRV